jgi:hypothetical protein
LTMAQRSCKARFASARRSAPSRSMPTRRSTSSSSVACAWRLIRASGQANQRAGPRSSSTTRVRRWSRRAKSAPASPSRSSTRCRSISSWRRPKADRRPGTRAPRSLGDISMRRMSCIA